MLIVVPSEDVMAVFTLMRLELVLPLYADREAAFAGFKPSADEV